MIEQIPHVGDMHANALTKVEQTEAFLRFLKVFFNF